MKKRILHLMTKDGQPSGVLIKCCEICDRAYWDWNKKDRRVELREDWTEANAIKHGYDLCGKE